MSPDETLLLQLAINGIALGSIYSLVALGFSVVYSVTGTLHYALGIIFTAAAYVVFFVNVDLHQSFGVSVACAFLVAALLGALVEVGVYRPMRVRKGASVSLFVGSLATAIIIQNVLALGFGTQSQYLSIGLITNGYSLMPGVFLSETNLIAIVVCAVLGLGVVVLLRWTRFGTILLGVADNPGMARIVGINVRRVELFAAILSAVVVVPAAALISVGTGINPYVADTIILNAIAAAFIGGIGSIPAAILGGYLIGLATDLSIWKLPTTWQSAITFAILLTFILLRPRGLMGRQIATADLQQ